MTTATTAKPTATRRITEFFLVSSAHQRNRWWSLEEFKVPGVSANAMAARMREMTRAGTLETRKRAGTNYNEWRLRLEREPEDFI